LQEVYDPPWRCGEEVGEIFEVTGGGPGAGDKEGGHYIRMIANRPAAAAAATSNS
jgi:hypothetical protein